MKLRQNKTIKNQILKLNQNKTIKNILKNKITQITTLKTNMNQTTSPITITPDNLIECTTEIEDNTNKQNEKTNTKGK